MVACLRNASADADGNADTADILLFHSSRLDHLQKQICHALHHSVMAFTCEGGDAHMI